MGDIQIKKQAKQYDAIIVGSGAVVTKSYGDSVLLKGVPAHSYGVGKYLDINLLKK